MHRPGAALAALGLAIAALPGAAMAQQDPPVDPVPVVTAPGPTAPAPVVATVRRDDVRLVNGHAVQHLEVAVPGAPDGTASVTWQAYVGSRGAAQLASAGHGRVQVPVRDGVLRFTRSVSAGGGYGRSAGFCDQVDLSGVGAELAAQPTCPDARTVTRRQLPSRVPEFSMYADSVGSGLLYGSGATTRAAGQYSAVFDLKVCRRLTYLPCPPNPPSAVSAIRSQPGAVGDIAVVDVGYNDWAQVYGVEQAISALKARGVRRIVWVTLREAEAGYGSINAMIRAAARRHAGLIQVADWNAASRGVAGFAADGVHLSGNSAIDALATFVNDEVGKAVAALDAK